MLRQVFYSIVIVALCGAALAQENSVDLLIQNARIVDGIDSTWFRSDVAIDGGNSVGFEYVSVNGVTVVADSVLTDERSGQFTESTGAR